MKTSTLKPRNAGEGETPDAKRSGASKQSGTRSRLSLRSAGISATTPETPERDKRIRGLWTFLRELPALRFAWPGFQPSDETPDAKRSGVSKHSGTSSRLSLRSAGISSQKTETPERRRRIRGLWPVLLAPALFLSGCFTSDVELIGARQATRALPPGEYTHTPFDTEGVEWGGVTWQGRIDYARFSRRYTSDAPNFPHQNARLRRLSGDIYIAQWPREDGVGYGVLFTYEGMATYHQADCHVLSAEQLIAAGITRDPEGFCDIETLDQLEQVIRTYLDILDGDVRIDGIYRRVG